MEFFCLFFKGFKKTSKNIEIQKSNGTKFICFLTLMELIYIKKIQCSMANVNRLQCLSFVQV